MAGFTGVPAEAVAFYAELEEHNTREWWRANKARYEAVVKEPMAALGDALADEFGTPKLFRPYRDVRFSPDKSPCKTHQGVVVATASHVGYYVQVSADGLMVAAGWWHGEGSAVASYRRAVDAASGTELVRHVRRAERAGLTLDADRMATRPRGVAADHPRLDLMRCRTLIFVAHDAPPAHLDDPGYADVVRARWRACRPAVEWLTSALQ